jgi:hypothetical protein
MLKESLTEGVEIDHSRHMRAHGKKASGSGQWIFTTKDSGEPSADEMVTVNGTLSVAGKEAAKKLKTNRVYVMEEIQLDEASLGGGSSSFFGSEMNKLSKEAKKKASEKKSEPVTSKTLADINAKLNTKKNESLDEVAIIKNNRKFSNVKWFETDKGANDFLEKNPEYGVLQSDKGGVYVALNKNKGTPLK